MASGDQKDWSRSRHEVRGSGSASRIRLNTGLLEEAGWKILSRESGNRVHLTYVYPEGKKFKSSKDVERKLEAEGILDQFVKENSSKWQAMCRPQAKIALKILMKITNHH